MVDLVHSLPGVVLPKTVLRPKTWNTLGKGREEIMSHLQTQICYKNLERCVPRNSLYYL